MPQNPWVFQFEGDPQDAILETQNIVGIHGKQLVSLQETILVFSECRPPANLCKISASEIVSENCVIRQQATFDEVHPGGDFLHEHPPANPELVYAWVGRQQQIMQWLRWAGRNACDEVMLVGSPRMDIKFQQRILDGKTIVNCDYRFQYRAGE